VLFRPLQNAQLRDILDEVAAELDRLTESEKDDVFVFRADGVSHRIPFREILFFEAVNKKVALHAAGQEVSYYDSIENIASVTPPYFVRCHRSYLVNTKKIKEMRAAEMELLLTGGERVPFSRSCRDSVKRALEL